MRNVIYSEYVTKKEYYGSEDKDIPQSWIDEKRVKRSYCELEEKGEALFHQWGVNYEEFETSAGNFSTAIIELEDGTVKNIPAEHIRFIGGEIDK